MNQGSEGWFDRILDRSVLVGYSALGHAIRQRGWAVDDPAPGVLAGRNALVTGAAGGLGEATALGLARLGARVHLLARTPQRAAPAVARITRALRREGLDADLRVEECDVSDLSAVRRFTSAFNDLAAGPAEALDILVHNAGVMPATRTESVDGHELAVATHVLGPVLLTELLRPALRRSRHGARVILMASGGMYTQPLPVDDPEYTRSQYRGAIGYARSKRVQVELAPLLAQRWAPDGALVYAMHPGWADTPGVATSLPIFRALSRPVLRTAAAGADTAVWLAATEPQPPTGTFWHDRTQRPTSYRAATRPTAVETAKMWTWVRGTTGLS